jgi:hypothetical protein
MGNVTSRFVMTAFGVTALIAMGVAAMAQSEAPNGYYAACHQGPA